MKHASLVKNIVERIIVRLPPHLAADREDMINVGIIGLMSAIEKFDENRNVKFETYATFRIRGAILDELRARDWAPRSTRSKASALEETFTALEKLLERAPDEEDICQYLGISPDEYFKLLDETRGIFIISSASLPPDYFESHSCYDVMEIIDYSSPLDILAGRELKEQLKEAIDALPEKERLVLSLYYYEELTMKEIGKIMELTESRVCQLHSQAILRLRGTVKDLR